MQMMLVSVLGLLLCVNSVRNNCGGQQYTLLDDYYNRTQLSQACEHYGLVPLQLTFSNFQEVLDDLEGCILEGEDNVAWLGGIEGYEGCMTLDLTGPVLLRGECAEDEEHMALCQPYEDEVTVTVTQTTTICPIRTRVTIDFTGRLERE